jgi:hypothetical protein
VLAGLGGEDNGADAIDLHGGGVPKLDGATHTLESKSEYSHHPIMWWVAPVSR